MTPVIIWFVYMLEGNLYMNDDYKTGDICPKTGNWLLIETDEVNVVVKGDVFQGYFDISGEFAISAPLRDATSMKRAHFKLLK